jgi:hypothetical protein
MGKPRSNVAGLFHPLENLTQTIEFYSSEGRNRF